MRDKSKRVSKRANGVPWSGVRKMFDMAQWYEGTINLSVGEPDFPTPSHIVEAAAEAMKRGYTHYTPNAGLLEFRAAAARKLRRENDIEVEPAKEIIATVGAMGALAMAMLAVVDSGEEVLIPNPGFASYEAQVLLADGKPVPYPVREECGFSVDMEALERLVSEKTKAILINSPANPTGAVLGKKELSRIAEIVIERDLLVISDEAYEAIVYDGAKHVSIASLPELKERAISVFSCSKTFAMTGWRIGYAAANEEITRQMIKLQEHLTAHPSSVSQMAAVAALQGPNDYLKAWVKEYTERRDFIVRELSEITGVKCLKPQGAFYVFPNIRAFNTSSNNFAMRILKTARVILVPGTAFGSNGEGYVRLSYATSKENIAEAMRRIKSALKT